MEIRREIKQINCYAGQNRPAWIVIHETDNYSKGAGALKHAQAHRNGNLSTSVHWYVDDTVQYRRCITATVHTQSVDNMVRLWCRE